MCFGPIVAIIRGNLLYIFTYLYTVQFGTVIPLLFVALGGLVVSVLATGPKVRGFDPDRGRWILRVIKVSGSKAVGPMS
jgi:hypothetical protein